MKDRADAMCPTVGTVKKRARPTFHLGHASYVHDCLGVSLFVYSKAESLQPAMKMVRSHVSLAGGFSWNLLLSCSSSLSRKHNRPRLGCEPENESTVTHTAVVIN